MIHGIGVDLVRISRMQSGLERFGERYARRILTTKEYTEFLQAPHRANFLAKRFAAKEAAVKAFGTGFRDGLALRHIGVSHDRLGRPFLEYSERASEMLSELGIGGSHLSISDEDDHALAFVTLIRGD